MAFEIEKLCEDILWLNYINMISIMEQFKYNNISKIQMLCPTLLEIGEEKSVYKVTTNSSEKDIIIFCKYAISKK